MSQRFLITLLAAAALAGCGASGHEEVQEWMREAYASAA